MLAIVRMRQWIVAALLVAVLPSSRAKQLQNITINVDNEEVVVTYPVGLVCLTPQAISSTRSSSRFAFSDLSFNGPN